MTRRRDFHVTGQESRRFVLGWIGGLELERFPDGIDVIVRVHEESATEAQRRHLFAALSDIAGQVEHAGMRLDPYTWGQLLEIAMRDEAPIPGLTGGLVRIGRRISKLGRRTTSDLIDYAYAFGIERGVRFRKPRDADN